MVELKLCRRSELHGKNLVLAPAVVDAVEQVDVALYAPQLLFRLARRVNKLGLVGAEAVNEPLPVVLAVVQLHEMDDTLNHLGSEGIRIAAPGFQQDGERFLVKLCADTLELRKGGIDAEDATRAAAPLKAHMKSYVLGRFVKLARRLILSAKIGAEPGAGRQGCGVAGLHGKQQGFISLCHTVVHLTEDRQVVVAVHVLARHNSMLPVKHIIVTVTKANLRFVGDTLIEPGYDLCHPLGVQLALVCIGNLQIPAADLHQLVECLNAVHCLFLLPI